LEENKAKWGLTKEQWNDFQVFVSAMEKCTN
jgi:hypothetical protein